MSWTKLVSIPYRQIVFKNVDAKMAKGWSSVYFNFTRTGFLSMFIERLSENSAVLYE